MKVVEKDWGDTVEMSKSGRQMGVCVCVLCVLRYSYKSNKIGDEGMREGRVGRKESEERKRDEGGKRGGGGGEEEEGKELRRKEKKRKRKLKDE
jgi:hypothetical protein